MTTYSFENKKKTYLAIALVFFVLGLWIFYMLCASRIGMRTVLMTSVPVWLTCITAGSVLGLCIAGRVTWSRPSGKKPKYIIECFFGGLSLGIVTLLNVYDVCVYLLPGQIIHYQSEYEIKFPGPAVGKYSHCEAGLWIKDIHTQRWLELCTNSQELYLQRKPGMNRVQVTARTNRFGSYIMEYQFVTL